VIKTTYHIDYEFENGFQAILRDPRCCGQFSGGIAPHNARLADIMGDMDPEL
jgi:hypothetical protein